MKIGVYGSAEEEANKLKLKARAIGRQIARKGHILVTGSCHGLPQEAVLGANEAGGKCIGFSPATGLRNHISKYKFPTEGFSKIIFIPKSYAHAHEPPVCKKYRNVSSVAEIDAAIFISGRIGSMNEFTIAYDCGKNIGVLTNSGGITRRAIKVLLKDAAKESKSKVIYEPNPKILVDKLVKIQ